ncbi:MAG: signal peptidase I [Bacillaceae bacterium]|nr:signal peptidase I [Bacillaceae bacterium]
MGTEQKDYLQKLKHMPTMELNSEKKREQLKEISKYNSKYHTTVKRKKMLKPVINSFLVSFAFLLIFISFFTDTGRNMTKNIWETMTEKAPEQQFPFNLIDKEFGLKPFGIPEGWDVYNLSFQRKPDHSTNTFSDELEAVRFSFGLVSEENKIDFDLTKNAEESMDNSWGAKTLHFVSHDKHYAELEIAKEEYPEYSEQSLEISHSQVNNSRNEYSKLLHINGKKVYARGQEGSPPTIYQWLSNDKTLRYMLWFYETEWTDMEIQEMIPILDQLTLEVGVAIDVISDPFTSKKMSQVEQSEGTIVVQYSSDNMELGDNPYNYQFRNLVVDTTYDVDGLNRGDVVYYKRPVKYEEVLEELRNLERIPESMARILALPGETIEIKNGQVFINGKKLDTFYGNEANNIRSRGTEEVLNMKKVKIPNGHIFTSGDLWWRSIDSRLYGPVPIENVIGKVMGYE